MYARGKNRVDPKLSVHIRKEKAVLLSFDKKTHRVVV